MSEETLPTNRVHGGGRFTILLMALLALLVIPTFLPRTTMATDILNAVLSIVAIGAAFDVSRHRATLLFVAFMAVATLLARAAILIRPDVSVGEVASEIFGIILFSLALRGVAQEVFGSKTVTKGTLKGAVCIYILMGVIWAIFYSLVETAHPGSFSYPDVASRSVKAGEPSPPGFFYYSFVTLTTLGYGDITPRAGFSRTLSWLEALAGQLFVAITLAQLVAIHVSENSRAGTPDSSGEDPPGKE